MADNDSGGQYVVPKTEDGKFVLKHKEFGEKTVSLEELHQLAQKSYGAEKAMQARAEAEKEVAKLQAQMADFRAAVGELQEAHRRADAGDPEAYGMILDFMGVEEEIKDKKLGAYTAVWERAKGRGAGEDDGDGTVGDKHNSDNPLSLEVLPQEVQELVKLYGAQEAKVMMARLRKQQAGEDKDKIYREVFEDLAKDPKLGKILGKGGPRAEKVKGLAKSLIAGRVLASDEYTPEQRAEVVKEVASLAEEFGQGSETTPIPGLGLGPGLSHLESQVDKPVERVPIGHPEYDDRSIRRLVQIARTSD